MNRVPDYYIWYDFEASTTEVDGIGVTQVALIVTDGNLNEIERFEMKCRLGDDIIPHPGAVLVTGHTPQSLAEFPSDYEVAEKTRELLLKYDGACLAGYNSSNFDDEVMRRWMYRNLMPPYDHEWKMGRSRLDLLPVLRMVHALAPGVFKWPTKEVENPDGTIGEGVSFKLDQLSGLNGIEHENAHDALADVECLIKISQMIRERVPLVWEAALKCRDWAYNNTIIDGGKPFLMTSPYLNKTNYFGLFMNVASSGKKERYVYNLMVDPAQFDGLSEQEIVDLIYSKKEDMPEGIERPGLTKVKTNGVPQVFPTRLPTGEMVLSPETMSHCSLDGQAIRANAKALMERRKTWERVVTLLMAKEFDPKPDWPDYDLYSGGFLSRDETHRIEQALSRPIEERVAFAELDTRVGRIVFLQIGRADPDLFNEEQREQWDRFVREKLSGSDKYPGYTIDQCVQDIAQIKRERDLTEQQVAQLDDLLAYCKEIKEKYQVPEPSRAKEQAELSI
ncbi:exodeoxyribonuclease I [Ferrimonas marina]|uniref:Exodeoxyribonuclease I n=1 Tax=Ferrimonas marina TaxID=299255 RepID=A0A1M5UKG1_9GAMM|nr:exodeoxyribonuclease I [Ferrimonas marina]SHH63400.1 Exodeoxyribonuclease I subunit C [Ferrimonas marina]